MSSTKVTPLKYVQHYCN